MDLLKRSLEDVVDSRSATSAEQVLRQEKLSAKKEEQARRLCVQLEGASGQARGSRGWRCTTRWARSEWKSKVAKAMSDVARERSL